MRKIYEYIIAQLQTLDIFEKIAVYNAQIDRALLGISSLPLMSCFVEIDNIKEFNLSQKLTGVDIKITIHIAHNELDATDGTLDQNLNIFSIRDKVHKFFLNLHLPNCGPILYNNENQQYNHTNLYHYVNSYNCHWIDISAYEDNSVPGGYIIWDKNKLIYDVAEVNWEDAYLFNMKVNTTF
jgi:hypothetical protein